MKLIKSQVGFTIIELLIVLTILATILAIAIPTYLRIRDASYKDSCIANLKQVQDAVDRWTLDSNVYIGKVPLRADIVPAYLMHWPKCEGVEYAEPAAGAFAVCPKGIESHVLGGLGSTLNASPPLTVTVPTIAPVISVSTSPLASSLAPTISSGKTIKRPPAARPYM